MKAKPIVARLLLAFVLVTIGFAWGRQTAPRPAAAPVPAAEPAAGAGGRLHVYSAHMTFRCWECNQIELTAREIVESDFAAELEDGLIAFESVDYLLHPDFARTYDIASSTVLLVWREDGRDVRFERLDEVWTKARQPDELSAYIRQAIWNQLDRGAG